MYSHYSSTPSPDRPRLASFRGDVEVFTLFNLPKHLGKATMNTEIINTWRSDPKSLSTSNGEDDTIQAITIIRNLLLCFPGFHKFHFYLLPSKNSDISTCIGLVNMTYSDLADFWKAFRHIVNHDPFAHSQLEERFQRDKSGGLAIGAKGATAIIWSTIFRLHKCESSQFLGLLYQLSDFFSAIWFMKSGVCSLK